MHYFTVLRTFIVLFIASLPFLGSDCNTNTTAGQTGGNISGTWKLDFVQGNLQDVCYGEVITFPSNTGGDATLTCPNSTPITRPYTYSNNVVTYTNSALQYSVTSDNSNNPTLLVFTGVGFGRTLSYKKVVADYKINEPSTVKSNGAVLNSSELNKTKE